MSEMSDKERMGDGEKELDGLNPADLLRQGVEEDTLVERMPSFDPPSLEELAEVFPGFEILELIGQGGMGAVYKVRQRDLERVAALKILPPAVGEELGFAERFTREAKAMAQLNHPGIVTLYEFGEAKGLYFFLMEYVDGVNLKQLLSGGRISSREALSIVPQICDALQFAHDQGIVHRDIKPENLLLDRRGNVKVADFGIAKVVGYEDELGGAVGGQAELTVAGKVMGTPDYMAPEQLTTPSEVDHRADIYALGVVFYQMLTGELPEKDLQAPSKRVALDVRLDEVVLRALEKDPERRYNDASQMKTMVEDAGEVGKGKSVGSAEKSSRSTVKWIMIILGVLFFGCVILTSVGSVMLYFLRANKVNEMEVEMEFSTQPDSHEVAAIMTADAERERLQENLLDLLVQKAELRTSGFGPNHPAQRAVQVELKAFEDQNPGLRDEAFRELVKKRKGEMLVQIEKLKVSGYGEAHPKVRALATVAERLELIVNPPSVRSVEVLSPPEVLIVDLVAGHSSSFFRRSNLTGRHLGDWTIGVYESRAVESASGEADVPELTVLSESGRLLLGAVPEGFGPFDDFSAAQLISADFVMNGLVSYRIKDLKVAGENKVLGAGKQWYYFEIKLRNGSSANGLLRFVNLGDKRLFQWKLRSMTVASDEEKESEKKLHLDVLEDGRILLRGKMIDFSIFEGELEFSQTQELEDQFLAVVATSGNVEIDVIDKVMSICADKEIPVTMVKRNNSASEDADEKE